MSCGFVDERGERFLDVIEPGSFCDEIGERFLDYDYVCVAVPPETEQTFFVFAGEYGVVAGEYVVAAGDV